MIRYRILWPIKIFIEKIPPIRSTFIVEFEDGKVKEVKYWFKWPPSIYPNSTKYWGSENIYYRKGYGRSSYSVFHYRKWIR